MNTKMHHDPESIQRYLLNGISRRFHKTLRNIATVCKGPYFFVKKIFFVFKIFPALIKYFDFRFFLKGPSALNWALIKGLFCEMHNACVSISDGCNYHCVFCFEHSGLQRERAAHLNRDKPEKNIALATYERLIDDLYFLGARSICLAGVGEPFLNPEIMNMVRYVKRKKMICEITTNGSLLRANQTKELVDLEVDRVFFSLCAATPEVFGKTTESNPNLYFKTIEAVKGMTEYKKKLKSRKPRITATNVITSDNYHQAVDMVKMAVDLGVDAVGFHKMYFCSQRSGIAEKLVVTPEQEKELRALLLEAKLIAKEANMDTNINFFMELVRDGCLTESVSYTPKVRGINQDIVVLSDGTVVALDFPSPIGKIDGSRFLKLWFSPAYCMLRSKAEILARKRHLFACISFCRGCDKTVLSFEQLRKIQ